MTPSVGRVVHFNTLDGRTLAAHVAEVITEDELVLYVLDPKEGASFKNATLAKEGEGKELRWNWMPYQAQQAAFLAAATKAVDELPALSGVPAAILMAGASAELPPQVPAVPIAEVTDAGK